MDDQEKDQEMDQEKVLGVLELLNELAESANKESLDDPEDTSATAPRKSSM